VTARLPTTRADARRADNRATATTAPLITPQPHRRTTDGTRAGAADATSVNDEGPPNNKEPLR
jgi:hypothetical protein